MNIKIISLRRTTDASIASLESEYLKRFRSYSNVEIIDIKRSKILSSRDTKSDLAKLKVHISSTDYCILLSDIGKQYTTEQFTAYIKEIIYKGTQSICFFIGGPDGFPDGMESLVAAKLSLSKMTLPHQLVRLFLIEALYRSFDMMHGGSYNK
jgi:23S rRNA (pseudouridine1915-N3)-methyltransferase